MANGGSVQRSASAIQNASLKNLQSLCLDSQPHDWPRQRAGNITAKYAKHTKTIPYRRDTWPSSKRTGDNGGNGENRGSIRSLSTPLPPVQKSQRRALMQRTSRLTDPAPVTLDLQPRRNREVRCSRFVRWSNLHVQKIAKAQTP